MQHVNAVIMLVICIFYFLFFYSSYYIEIGIAIWASSLIFLYFPDLFTIPGGSKEEIMNIKIMAIVAGWLWMSVSIGLVTESRLFKTLGVVLFILLIVSYLIHERRKRKIKSADKKTYNKVWRLFTRRTSGEIVTGDRDEKRNPRNNSTRTCSISSSILCRVFFFELSSLYCRWGNPWWCCPFFHIPP